MATVAEKDVLLELCTIVDLIDWQNPTPEQRADMSKLNAEKHKLYMTDQMTINYEEKLQEILLIRHKYDRAN